MFIFLPVTLAVYYIVPFRAKNPVLLLCSLIFYAWGEPVYVFLMILNIAFNYVMGLDIEMNADNPVRKRISLILCMIFNLGLLGFFKYFGFVMENIDALPGVNIPYHEVGLPIGISFYTFQVMSYIIDVYKGKISAQKNPLTLGVYVTMFPQLIAGPIVQYSDVERQLAERVISLERFGEGTRIFIIGLAKKVLLANSAGSVFKSLSDIPYSELSVLSAWILAIAFTFQIYFDFSGYSDMAGKDAWI
jgi:alginate O-acetyltransferase complex protein AlgI